MQIRQATVVVEYKWFEVGEEVMPCSPRCSLEMGKVYIVKGCHEPRYSGDDAFVFVEGKDTGVSAEYLMPVY